MQKKLQIDKYDFHVYPRLLWVVIGKNAHKIADLFTFYYTSKDKIINSDILKNLESGLFAAGTYSIHDNKTGQYGVLLYIPVLDNFDNTDIAHEAVHIADYIFQETGMYTEDFADGNEHYAYLVGYIAGCISNSIIKAKKDDSRRE